MKFTSHHDAPVAFPDSMRVLDAAGEEPAGLHHLVAGVVHGGQHRHQRVVQVALQSAFAVLFFVSVGMLFDPTILVRQPLDTLYVFADHAADVRPEAGIKVFPMPSVADEVAPIVYTVPLQLLSYYVAVLKGTDVDQPRNLAKSVTVE